MAGIKETVQVNVQETILGAEEAGFSFVNEFRAMPGWKQTVIFAIIVSIIPAYVLVRIGSEQYLTQQYGRQALSAHSAFNASQSPLVGPMSIVRNPNNTYSGLALVTNPNIDLAATGIAYTAEFLNAGGEVTYTAEGSMYLLPNEKKYVVIPRVDITKGAIVSGKLTLGTANWQKKLSIPEVKLRATEPILKDESNPLTFIVEGSVINESPYQVGSARIVFILYDSADKIIGVSQRDEYRLVPFGRRTYVQQWPGIYRDQVKKVQVMPSTNTLDPLNITTDPTNASNP